MNRTVLVGLHYLQPACLVVSYFQGDQHMGRGYFRFSNTMRDAICAWLNDGTVSPGLPVEEALK